MYSHRLITFVLGIYPGALWYKGSNGTWGEGSWQRGTSTLKTAAGTVWMAFAEELDTGRGAAAIRGNYEHVQLSLYLNLPSSSSPSLWVILICATVWQIVITAHTVLSLENQYKFDLCTESHNTL